MRELIEFNGVRCKEELGVASEWARLEQENTRLSAALGDAYAVLGKTRTALTQLQAQLGGAQA